MAGALVIGKKLGPNANLLINLSGRGDKDVKSVFVNVFGGITACDAVANGIVAALETLGATATKPIVVRLDGNNVEEGRAILNAANHSLVEQLDTMDGAASRAAELAAK